MPEQKTTLVFKCRSCSAEYTDVSTRTPSDAVGNLGGMFQPHDCASEDSRVVVVGVAELIRAERKRG